jgi:hypothetical protein
VQRVGCGGDGRMGGWVDGRRDDDAELAGGNGLAFQLLDSSYCCSIRAGGCLIMMACHMVAGH